MNLVKFSGPAGNPVYISTGGECIIEIPIGGAEGSGSLIKCMAGDVYVKEAPDEAAAKLQTKDA